MRMQHQNGKILARSLFLTFLCLYQSYSLTTYPIKVVVQQNETVQFNPLFKAIDTADKTVQLSVTTQVKNGALTVIPGAFKKGSVIVPGFQYIPNSDFTGVDSMEWSIGNSLGSATGTCKIIVQPPEPGKMLVLIYVNDLLYPKLTSEINRLKDDLKGEGYNAKIKLWHNNSTQWTDNVKPFHDSIQAEFDLTNGLMAGTIGIGRLPVFYWKGIGREDGEDDSKYWNVYDWTMTTDTLVWGNLERSCRHIWFCRMFGGGTWGATTSIYGPESLLIKRALQANHDYRTGAQRLPHTAWCYGGCDGFRSTSFTTALSKIWPKVTLANFSTGGCGNVSLTIIPYIYGGELADTRPYGWLGNTDAVMESFSPIRVFLHNICGAGKIGDFANMHQFPRVTGNVLAICATTGLYGMGFEDTIHYGYGTEPYTICDTTFKVKKVQERLASGTRWGRAWLQSNMQINHLGIYGDLTLKPNMSPSNEIPIIDSVRADQVSGKAPFTVSFQCGAHDTDGNVALYEWYPEDHDWGRKEPEIAGESQTTWSHTYYKPYHYFSRVNVFDNYKAGAFKGIDVYVAPAAGDTLRVRCGNPRPCFQSRYEYTDTQGKLWQHDQVYHAGTWGSDTGYGATATGWISFHTNPGPSDENSFTYMASVPTSETAKPYIGYKIPLVPGQYKVTLGFADWTSAGTCVMDLELNGVVWKEAFSPSALVGAKKNCTIDTTIDFAGGELAFKVKRNAATPTTIILNNFEIDPIGFQTTVDLSPNGRLANQLVVSPNPFSTLTLINIRLNNPNTCRENGEIKASILDIRGKTIKQFTLAANSGALSYQGSLTWDGADLDHKVVANGLYFFIIKGHGLEMKRSMLLVR